MLALYLLIFCSIITILPPSVSLGVPSIIRLGAIFTNHKKAEEAFKYAVHRVNEDKDLLKDTRLTYDITHTHKNQSFPTCKKVCSQIRNGAQAIFGPSDGALDTHVHSICDALDIPHLVTRIDFEKKTKMFSINLHPTQHYTNLAFADLVHYLNWTVFAIIHEQNHGIINLREVVRMPNVEVLVRHVHPKTYASVLHEIKEKEVHNVIVDTNGESISLLLKHILQLQMNEYKYHYIFTSFDIEVFDVEDFKYNFVNITSFRLVDVNNVGVKEILRDMDSYIRKNDKRADVMTRKLKAVSTESALIHDAVYIFAIGLQMLKQSHTLTMTNASCSQESPWDGGLSLINYINSVEWRGLTGPIQFKEGRRIQFKLDVVQLKPQSLLKIGEWTPNTRLNITDVSSFYDTGSINATLVVITILETPYVMMHYDKNITGNDRFFGFCVDILKLVARNVGFDFILDLVPDRKYGAKDPVTKEWNGMVAQLMKNKADLAVGSMTITYARSSVIDFTKPFMNLGISILFKVPSTPPSRLFSFMNPLALDVWIYVLAAYFLVSLAIYLIAKLSPFESRTQRFCRQQTGDRRLGGEFSVINCLWFTISTLMQQGSDISPKSFSLRIISCFWWLFTLIIITSYTANLAAFLTVERMTNPIESAEDLASQTEISYGTLESGSTMAFFRDSMIETYRKMWRHMDNKRKPSAFTTTYEEGINRVNEGNYAFLMESTMLDYIVQRNCNLTQIGGLLDTKGYGIATPKGSPWRDRISLAILKLQEKGDIQMLYDKWWKNSGETCIRKSNKKQSKANALDMDHIGGIFVVLIVGIVFAIIVAISEFLFFFRQRESEFQTICKSETFDEFQLIVIKTNRRSVLQEMLEEFRYALHFMDSRRRPALAPKCSNCIHLTRNLQKLHDENQTKISEI